jgi:hypothetical protein
MEADHAVRMDFDLRVEQVSCPTRHAYRKNQRAGTKHKTGQERSLIAPSHAQPGGEVENGQQGQNASWPFR